MLMRLADICAAAGIAVSAEFEALAARGVSMDSRAITAGDLFVCIAGERVDGHDYAAQAVRAGAIAVLAERALELPTDALAPVLVVPDSVKALGQVAHAWRARFTGKVVGVTGSAGKTTVKEVLAQVLTQHGPTARNPLNLNNQIGMPLSLLAATGEERFWVMEAGISKAHDMDELASVLRPDVGLVLNAGAAHSEGLGGRGVAYHKAQLLAGLNGGGLGIASADYPDLVREVRAVCPQATFFSSTGRPVAYRAAYSGVKRDGDVERGVYRLWLDGKTLDVVTPFVGSYGAENAVAIAAAAHALGLSATEIVDGFATASLPQQRFQVRQRGGLRIIDDTYNANPLSMTRMLDAAVEMAMDAGLYAVLGAMGELGDVAQQEHEKLGRHVARSRVRALFWRGSHLEDVRVGLEAENWPGKLYEVQSVEDFVRAWAACAPRGGVVLCKGSRSNRLEELVEVLTACEEVN